MFGFYFGFYSCIYVLGVAFILYICVYMSGESMSKGIITEKPKAINYLRQLLEKYMENGKNMISRKKLIGELSALYAYSTILQALKQAEYAGWIKRVDSEYYVIQL